ncbi:hypothetical protein RND71_006520 [Anisodus tanguticus]|uniref:TF-B3 domain-containing protein n=1 Tax=Anisodus tanguticus TaxID=243964 RepID=A0AAE1SUC9_9SOLA|nr:hypothetical protein RND71_006520 [Anisodus tanguticus]
MATSMERDYIADDIPGFLKKYRHDTCSQHLNDLTAIEELELHPLDEENGQAIGTAIQEAAPLADQALDGSGNSIVAISLFEVVMKESDFLKMMFNIPAAFGNKYMKKGQKFEKTATLQIGSKNWQVVVRSYDRLKFRNGWLGFVRDNNLRVGDVLCFKLIDEEKFIMKKIPSGFLKFFNGDIPVNSLLEVEGPINESTCYIVWA